MRIIRLLFTFTLFVAIFSISSNTVQAATYSVTNTNDSGAGSLRQAIINANSTTASDSISFSVGSGSIRISLSSALPPIIYPVSIDGTSQPGFSTSPIVEISGTNAGTNSRGLYITGSATGSSVRGLVINSFGAQGIFIDTNNVSIKGNYIGTNVAGTAALPNKGDGVAIFSGTSIASANGNTIGGSVVSDRNVISGNQGNGVGITAQVGGNASNNSIVGNFIGTNASGTAPIPNNGDGVLINHADGGGAATAANNKIGDDTGTTPGGACTGACNLISGNGANGIGLWHGGVQGTTVKGNLVGTNHNGTSAIANGNIGIEINEAPNNSVGGTSPSARNIFSGNGGSGVFFTGSASTGNTLEGNYIGTDTTGSQKLENQKMGIGIGASPGAVGANSNRIGGTTNISVGGACTGSCNLISGNHDNGIFITGSESYGHIIEGNFIGVDVSGSYGIGNGLDGIGILHTPNTRIGGNTDSHRNIISSNGGNGVIIAGQASTGNLIEGNFIGKNSLGQSSGNQFSGIAVSSASYNIFLENTIAFNGNLAIDLDNNGSPNINDLNDGDSGANSLQNYPTIYAANTRSGITKIGGQFNSVPNGTFRLEFFENDSCNAGAPNDFGEGQKYLGYTMVSTDQFGNTSFGFTSPSTVAGNKYITATATLSETSEFSQCILVNASKPALTNGATWFLKYGLTTGPANHTFGYGFPSYLLMCAWDGTQPGVKLPVIYSGGGWYMRASYTTGTADLSFSYGNGGHKPICGDWNGDGVDTVGVIDSTMVWHLRNSNSSGGPDIPSFQYGPTGSTIIAGDWDGDGDDSIGVVNGTTWYLRNSASSGGADAASFTYGSGGSLPIAGDWDGDGADSIGVVANGTWSLRNNLNISSTSGQFQYGFSGATPVIW